MKRSLALSLVFFLGGPVAWADDADDLARARVRLTTDAAVTAHCIRVGAVGDDSVKDLRKKIVRSGGDTAVVSFGRDSIAAQVFRCGDRGAATTPSAAPPSREEVAGTGFMVTPDGVLLTAFHIVEGAKTLTVTCPNQAPSAATLFRVARSNDIALLRTSITGVPWLVFAPSGSLRVGEPVFTVGFPVPEALGVDLSDGVISSLSGFQGDASLVQITVPVQPGNSGGPLVNDAGQAVGMVLGSARVVPFLAQTGTLAQNVNWAVKSEYALPMLRQPTGGPPVKDRQEAIGVAIKATCMVQATQ